MSFYEEEDIDLTQFETPIAFLRRVPTLFPAASNCLIRQVDKDTVMQNATGEGRKLWKSGADLVLSNKLRGYCISKALIEDNLVVSNLHCTFALKRPTADDLPDDPKRLFVTLMVKRYGHGVLDVLLPDVHEWLQTLEAPSESDGLMAAYHAWMLSDEGRGWLSVRLAQLLTGELHDHVLGAGSISQFILENFHHMSLGLDDMHPFFKEWCIHSDIMKENMKSWEQPDVLPEELERVNGGRWVVMMNRHGYMHSHSKKLQVLACGNRYTKNNVVGLLQYRQPLYLPLALRYMKECYLWDLLDMDSFFKKTLPQG